jgi:Domain of unknown function (DUF4158)
VASIERTAYPRFKRTIAAKELREAFTPGADEVAWAREATRSHAHLLGLVVLLKCFQRLGYFPKLADVPAAVVEHVPDCLELPGDVALDYDADRTLRHYKALVRDRLGVPAARRPHPSLRRSLGAAGPASSSPSCGVSSGVPSAYSVTELHRCIYSPGCGRGPRPGAELDDRAALG